MINEEIGVIHESAVSLDDRACYAPGRADEGRRRFEQHRVNPGQLSFNLLPPAYTQCAIVEPAQPNPASLSRQD
jgi:hypothetical protein